MRQRLRRYAIEGRAPRALLRLRSGVLDGRLPPRVVLPPLAWSSYWLAKPELRVMRTFVDPRRRSIDVGANVGVHSYFLARWSSHVVAYEPNPELQGFLRRALGPRVSLSRVALSDREGGATLSVPLISGEAADPYGSLEPSRDQVGDDTRGYAVRTAPLDAMDHRCVGFIKIDVEGHEAAVIQGALETLDRERPALLIEVEHRHASYEVGDLFATLDELGYRGRFLYGDRLRPLAEFSMERHQHLPLRDPASGPYVENFFFEPVAPPADSARRDVDRMAS